MFCAREDLVTESDVEQKLIWPLLTAAQPAGAGLSPVDLRTKPNIRRLLIGKGETQKLYYPDYVAVFAGLPVLIVEAKKPGEDVVAALAEARLYANELNAIFPTGINPCSRVLATNGESIVSSPVDAAQPDHSVQFGDIDVSNAKYSGLIGAISRETLKAVADTIQLLLAQHPLYRPLNFLGGTAIRNQPIPNNTFGSNIALDFRHLFNPQTREDRAFIVKHAYIRSERRERYIVPIDKVVRAAIPPVLKEASLSDDTAKQQDLFEKLRKAARLEHQVLLLIGGVGSGKTTFADHLQEVALPQDIRDATLWARIDLNEAPVNEKIIYTYVLGELKGELQASAPDLDWDARDALEKLYSVELNRMRKGELARLNPASEAYEIRIADELGRLRRDLRATVDALVRYLCAERGKALIIVLDNCDKQKREHQLLMFQVAQWLKKELRCLVFLPLRDVTYDLHRNEPPLDTALKDLVFRIEAPAFSRVLTKRIQLALAQMTQDTQRRLTYSFANGLTVDYPASDQGMYLMSILRSLYDHDGFIRSVISGLAGRDLRRAMEIFLEFCNSGYIDELEIYKIRRAQGQYSLPYHVVVQVLLRMNRRFYDGDLSYLRNVFQCHPNDPRPDHLARVAILRLLQKWASLPGPTGIRGYHRCGKVVSELVSFGHNADRLRNEILYLVRAGCIVAEHQSKECVSDEDLIIITSAGWVHLDMLSNIHYLAACAEDTWIPDEQVAQEIAERIGVKGAKGQLSETTQVDNAAALLDQVGSFEDTAKDTRSALGDDADDDLHSLALARRAVKQAKRSPLVRKSWSGVAARFPAGTERVGTVRGRTSFGIFVELEPGIS